MNDEQDEISHQNQADAEDESNRAAIFEEREELSRAEQLRRHHEALNAVWLREVQEDVRALSEHRQTSMAPHRRRFRSDAARKQRSEARFSFEDAEVEAMLRRTMRDAA